MIVIFLLYRFSLSRSNLKKLGVVIVRGHQVKFLKSSVDDVDQIEFVVVLFDTEERPACPGIFTNFITIVSV